jgi:hypothetical protein
VIETWSPPLRLDVSGNRCRLLLGGLTYGNGDTLQEAADDLVARLLNMAVGFRSGGFRLCSEIGAPDRRALEFLWELGEIAARDGDIRERVFGAPRPAVG